ncbi:hypothetical protein D9M71_629070 [compost metagenome]
MLQGTLQPQPLLLTGFAPVPFGDGIDQAQTLVPVDVAGLQPAGQWRQVVGAGGGQGIVRPVENGFEVAGWVLLELQHAHTENGALPEFFPKPGGNGAQVFTQDNGAVTHRLQAQQAQ